MKKKKHLEIGFMISNFVYPLVVFVSMVALGCGPPAGGPSQPGAPGAHYEDMSPEHEQDYPADPGDPTVPGEMEQDSPHHEQHPPTGEQGIPGGGEPGVLDVSDEQMDVYVRTYQEVMQLQRELENNLRQAVGGEEAQRLQEEAERQLTVILQRNGLTLESYKRFFNQLSQNRELQSQFQERLQEAADDSRGGI